MTLSKSTRSAFQWIILALLGCAALASLAKGINHAFLYRSHDMQWMGGVILSHHIDPYYERLAGYPHGFLRVSPPNYLHLLYVLLLPLHSLSFKAAETVWCTLSILFSIGSVLLLRRIFSLDTYRGLLLLFLLWLSAPFRVVLEVGQMSLFELFFFCLTFAAASTWLAGVAFGLTSVKYSFSPVLGVLLLLRRRFGLLAVAILVSLVALLGVRAMVSTPLLQLLREPFVVSRISVSPGLADIMTLAEYALRPHIDAARATTISYALGVLGACAYAFLLSRYRLSRRADLALTAVGSLFFFKHLTYDFVFLAAPLAYALTLRRIRSTLPVFAGVVIFWGFSAILDRAAADTYVSLPRLTINAVLLLAFLVYTTVVVLRHEAMAEHQPVPVAGPS